MPNCVLLDEVVPAICLECRKINHQNALVNTKETLLLFLLLLLLLLPERQSFKHKQLLSFLPKNRISKDINTL
jgi:hypothetical protein